MNNKHTRKDSIKVASTNTPCWPSSTSRALTAPSPPRPSGWMRSFPAVMVTQLSPLPIDQQIIKDPIEPFLGKFIAIAPEEWLIKYWQGLETNLQINARLFTETGKFNPIFKEIQKKVLRILDQIYQGTFSSELLKDGAKVYCFPDFDENQGHISFHGRWGFKATFPF